MRSVVIWKRRCLTSQVVQPRQREHHSDDDEDAEDADDVGNGTGEQDRSERKDVRDREIRRVNSCYPFLWCCSLHDRLTWDKDKDVRNPQRRRKRDTNERIRTLPASPSERPMADPIGSVRANNARDHSRADQAEVNEPHRRNDLRYLINEQRSGDDTQTGRGNNVCDVLRRKSQYVGNELRPQRRDHQVGRRRQCQVDNRLDQQRSLSDERKSLARFLNKLPEGTLPVPYDWSVGRWRRWDERCECGSADVEEKDPDERALSSKKLDRQWAEQCETEHLRTGERQIE